MEARRSVTLKVSKHFNKISIFVGVLYVFEQKMVGTYVYCIQNHRFAKPIV